MRIRRNSDIFMNIRILFAQNSEPEHKYIVTKTLKKRGPYTNTSQDIQLLFIYVCTTPIS